MKHRYKNNINKNNITQLHIYDFDGTLFWTPLPEKGRQFFSRVSGRPWPHRGWWGQRDTLRAPFHVVPGPALFHAQEACRQPHTYTVMMTGRLNSLKPQVFNIMKQHSFFPHRSIFKRPSGGTDTLSYKVRHIREMAKQFPNLETIEIWEDREQHAQQFVELLCEDRLTSSSSSSLKSERFPYFKENSDLVIRDSFIYHQSKSEQQKQNDVESIQESEDLNAATSLPVNSRKTSKSKKISKKYERKNGNYSNSTQNLSHENHVNHQSDRYQHNTIVDPGFFKTACGDMKSVHDQNLRVRVHWVQPNNVEQIDRHLYPQHPSSWHPNRKQRKNQYRNRTQQKRYHPFQN